MAEYQGHRNRAHWNVALWIGNDEGLYRLALDCLRGRKTKDEAAKAMLAALREANITHTPDGAAYSVTAIRAALAGLE